MCLSIHSEVATQLKRIGVLLRNVSAKSRSNTLTLRTYVILLVLENLV